MMLDIKVPDLPESVEEATLMSWHKKAGESVTRDEKIADIETDKVVLEVAAQQDGVLKEILAQEGQTIRRGDLLGRLEPGQAAKTEKAAAPSSKAAPTKPPKKQEAPPTPPAPTPTPNTSLSQEEQEGLSPAVRKIIAENNLEVSSIEGTGRGGRITKADVVRHIEASPAVTAKLGSDDSPAPIPRPTAPREKKEAVAGERRVPMTRLRAKIAERLVEAQQNAAMLTTFNEVNMQPTMDLRSRYKEKFAAEYGVKLGFMSFFIKAVIDGLKKFPIVNASVDGTDILYHEFFDCGIAVSSPRGLVVPIIRDSDQLSFAELEAKIQDFSSRAQEAQLTIDELTGGTFTISNGGVFGSLMSTPILNPPQSAILGMHRIQERPVAENGQVVIRPMMYLALSYDHRIVDGKEAVQFLVSMKQSLEEPARLLLEV